jgi:hypothetical protein
LNVVLGPEIEVTLICNESQVAEVVDFIHAYDGSAVDIVEAVEAAFDCHAVNPEYVDPFNWRPAGQPQDYDIRAILKAIEDAYGMESGELDAFVNDYPRTQEEKDSIAHDERFGAPLEAVPFKGELVDDQQMVDWKITIRGYFELNQADRDHARGVIAEAFETFNEFEGSFSITKDEEPKHPRTCSHCGKGMSEGYCIEGGESYYCSPECLHANMTEEEYLELHDDGNGDSYWTEWEEDDNE